MVIDQCPFHPGMYHPTTELKSLLKVPKYTVCDVLMQRQLEELRGVGTMSKEISVHSDQKSDAGYSVSVIACGDGVSNQERRRSLAMMKLRMKKH